MKRDLCWGLMGSMLVLLGSLLVAAAFADEAAARTVSLADTVSIVFSPDGQAVAYVSVDVVYLPTGFHPPRLSQTAYVRWCPIDRLKGQKSVKIDSFGRGKSGYSISQYIDIVFSADSRHLAVLSPQFVTVIDLKSEKHWHLTPRGEKVTSLVWIGEEEVAYAAHANIRDNHKGVTIADRTFWRQDIQDSPDDRVQIYGEEGVETGIDTWTGPRIDSLEHWSPKGAYVIFMSPSVRGCFHVVDVNARIVRQFGHSNAFSEGVSWKPDGSAAVTVSQVVGMGRPLQALLLDPTTVETYDFSEAFGKAFGEFAPTIDTVWPAGSEYFIGNDTKLGGCLVRPRPWHVIEIGKQLCKHLGTPARPDAGPPWVYRLPQVGWVRAQATAGDALDRSQWYAVDYEGQRFIQLTEAGWAWSPLGTHNAKVDYGGTITVQEIAPDLVETQEDPAP